MPAETDPQRRDDRGSREPGRGAAELLLRGRLQPHEYARETGEMTRGPALFHDPAGLPGKAVPTAASALGVATFCASLSWAFAQASGRGPLAWVLGGIACAAAAVFLVLLVRSTAWQEVAKLRDHVREVEVETQRSARYWTAIRRMLLEPPGDAEPMPESGHAVLVAIRETLRSAGVSGVEMALVLVEPGSFSVVDAVGGWHTDRSLLPGGERPGSAVEPFLRARGSHYHVSHLAISGRRFALIATAPEKLLPADRHFLDGVAAVLAANAYRARA